MSKAIPLSDLKGSNMARWIQKNEFGGFEVWQSLGVAREHIGTFKRESFAKEFASEPLETLRQCVTEAGACCWSNHDSLPRRIYAVNDLANATLAKAGVK